MHKIKKGIKKKIKGKKGKDTELFTPEEYERYKKQKEEESRLQQEHLEEVQTQSEDHLDEEDSEEPEAPTTEENTGESNKEDWRKFFSATDTVLKKTTVNLEHIKESSYFQAKKAENTQTEEKPVSTSPVPAAVSTKGWIDLDKGGIDDSEDVDKEEQGSTEEQDHQSESPKVKEPAKDIVLKPIEDIPVVAEEDFADVFDTTYVDAVEGGEVQLYQIPDSPTFENLNEPDPFDTSNAEKVLRIEKEEPEAKKEVPEPVKTQKKKKNLVNLGCAVDILTGKAPETALQKKKESQNEVNLLADFEDNEETKVEQKEKEPSVEDSSEKEEKEEGVEEEKEKCALDELLFGEEQNVDLPEVVIPKELSPVKSKSEPDKKEGDQEDIKKEENILEDNLSEFLDPLTAREESSSPKKDSHLEELISEFDVIDKQETVSLILSTKTKGIDDNIQDEFDAEFAVLAAESIAKEKEKAIDEIGVLGDDDPFDTSLVTKVLGEESEHTQEPVDPFDTSIANDFIQDKSKDKKPPPPRPGPPKRSPVDILDEDPFDTSVATKVLPSDPFETIEDDLKLPETLKPLSDDQKIEGDSNFDPFDTSAAESFGKTELKVLEGELLSDINKKEDDLDFDFNPREEEDLKAPPRPRPPSPACLLTSATETPEAPVLTPQSHETLNEDFDPFDTSIAEKVHIKSLEEELLSDTAKQHLGKKNHPPRPPSPSALLASLQVKRGSVQLSSIAKVALDKDFDPFDTSIADNLETPNKEEEEIILSPSSKNLDLKFKPPRPASPFCLLATTPTDANPLLEPTKNSAEDQEDFDPFDTSIAAKFGKTELKVLETELLNKTSNEIELDNDFDPRSEDDHLKKKEPPPRPVSPACLLTSSTCEIDQKLPPLSPVTTKEFSSVNKEIDPFDTSIADTFGKAEIKTLESELLTSEVPQSFEESKVNVIQSSLSPPPSQCLFATTPCDSNPPLQPFCEELKPKEASTAEEIDPFDTSIAEKFGKGELKVLEESLLTEESQILDTESRCDTLKTLQKSDLFDISPSAEKLPVLQPHSNCIDIAEDIDPFDTSIASQFGKVELKVLESELLVDSGTKRNLSDDEFDPRGEEPKSCKRKSPVEHPKSILDLQEQLPEDSAPVLKVAAAFERTEEIEADPFDTSIADNLAPGKQELELLNKELLGST